MLYIPHSRLSLACFFTQRKLSNEIIDGKLAVIRGRGASGLFHGTLECIVGTGNRVEGVYVGTCVVRRCSKIAGRLVSEGRFVVGLIYLKKNKWQDDYVGANDMYLRHLLRMKHPWRLSVEPSYARCWKQQWHISDVLDVKFMSREVLYNSRFWD